ncbi:urease accessory protein UreD [Tepidamorphus sp. 3E244]|uniref:urease accessory protein UreD n=1 Tax=Tepidamorphus sp. 3E244 TaxID=3385498 RepID=UPI0038FCF406
MNIRAASTEFLQRTSGEGRLRVRASGDSTRLADLYQQDAAKIRLPRLPGATHAEAIIINTAGGLTGGDDLRWTMQADASARLTVTTQACEKVYRSGGGAASVAATLKVEAGAHVAWLPQEIILFDTSNLQRRLHADIAADASLLACEAVIFGRGARGEQVTRGRFRDHWEIRCEKAPVHREDVRIEGPVASQLDQPAIGAGLTAFATVLLVAKNAPDKLARVRALLDAQDDTRAAASALPAGPTGKLLARIAARDGYALRKTLVPLLALLNSEAGMPRIWST